MKKAVLYARVSSTRQRNEGWSIPAQIKFLREYAQKNNIEIVKEFVEDIRKIVSAIDKEARTK